MTISKIDECLKNAPFVRVHKCFIVNCRKIVSFSRNEIVMKSGEKILVGIMFYKDAIQKYLNFVSTNSTLDFTD